jgi:hypothetical protein
MHEHERENENGYKNAHEHEHGHEHCGTDTDMDTDMDRDKDRDMERDMGTDTDMNMDRIPGTDIGIVILVSYRLQNKLPKPILSVFPHKSVLQPKLNTVSVLYLAAFYRTAALC